ncbi:MAG TPA: MliC family protein [Alphaproteobacteria bacterium]|nr:MliC family protein [Alphaproteobacteria bacterium]
MKKLLLCFITVLAVCGCDKSHDSLKCGEYEVTVKLQGDILTTVINGDAVDLKQGISASGVRYVGVLNDTNVVMWNKGEHWTLFLNDEPVECE